MTWDFHSLRCRNGLTAGHEHCGVMPDGSLPTVEEALATRCCDEHPECSHTYEVWERHRLHATTPVEGSSDG